MTWLARNAWSTRIGLEPVPPVPAASLIAAAFNIVLAIFSLWTVTNQIAFLVALSFRELITFFWGVLLLVTPLLTWSYFREAFHVGKHLYPDQRKVLWLLLALALAGAAVSVGAIRPDGDDVNYTSRVVYYLEHPAAPLDLNFHDFWMLHSEMFSPLKIFQTWTFLCGFLAEATNLPFLDFYHIYLPAIGGAAIPLAWFLTFTKFTNDARTALLGALAVCVFLALDGEPHRSFGNFAFVRIWHSKAMMLTIFVPLFLYLSLDFFETPTAENWKRVLLILVSSGGLSSTALFFMPFLGLLFATSAWHKYPKAIRAYSQVVTTYLLAYGYLILLALYTLVSIDRKRLSYLGYWGWPDSFAGQFRLVFIDWLSIPFLTMVAFTIIVLFYTSSQDRRFVLTWLILAIVLFLNPIVFPFVSQYFTTLNAYWRLFYLLPFPFVIGLSMTMVGRLATHRPSIIAITALFLVAVAIAGNSVFPKQTTFGKVPFAFLHYKFEPQILSDAKQIIAVSNPGPMLAPRRYSEVIPILTSRFPQVVVRAFNLLSYAIAKGEENQAQLRIDAQKFVSGDSSTGLEDLHALMEKGLITIVINPDLIHQQNHPQLRQLLQSYGFLKVYENERFYVFTRSVTE